jgi:hypothetical protein
MRRKRPNAHKILQAVIPSVYLHLLIFERPVEAKGGDAPSASKLSIWLHYQNSAARPE